MNKVHNTTRCSVYRKRKRNRLGMKNSHFLFLVLFSLTVFTSSFNFLSIDDLEFKYLIKGVTHELNEGLKPSEFDKLTIELTNHEIKIEAFQITLSRGNRAVNISDVKSNTFNLRKFYGEARSGDRIVIEIKKLSDQTISKNAATVMTIRVN